MRSNFVRFLAHTLPHLAIFAVMLLTLAPQSNSFWQCEGQKCGDTSWLCCCSQPADVQDIECGDANSHFSRESHAAEVGPCPVDCHCTMVVQDNAPTVHSGPVHFTAPVLAVTVSQFVPTFQPAFFTEPPRARPSRGPPLRPVYLAASCLRGPPLA